MILQLKTINLPPLEFTPLDLSAYDQLPVDIMLVGSFKGLMDVDQVAKVFASGLQHFPHLSGVVCEQSWRILPAEHGIDIEVATSDQQINTSQLEQTPVNELYHSFLPDKINWDKNRPLFGLKMVHYSASNQTVLGIRVSHIAVDGAGLALFLKACFSSISDSENFTLHHQRKLLSQVETRYQGSVPLGYELSSVQQVCDLNPAVNNHLSTLIFTIPIQQVKEKWGASSLIETRLCLAAWLSAECAEADSTLTELAIWCDVRGILGLSQTYTGNCGCFLHYPLSKSTVDMTKHWRHLTSRKGFKQVAEVFSAIVTSEKSGNPLKWKNAENVLQVNIVPHSIASVDFGYGRANFGIILARNSPGIRISISPDEQHFLLEVELKPTIQDHLTQAAQSEGFTIQLWGQGNDD